MIDDSYFRTKLTTITSFIQANAFALKDPSLKWGKLGLAVFLNQLMLSGVAVPNQEITSRLFEASMEGIDLLGAEAGLGEILSDAAGIIYHLSKCNQLAFEVEDLLATIDPFLITYLSTTAGQGNLDLVIGALAPAHYLLDRAVEFPALLQPLDKFILQLDTLAIRPVAGHACWESLLFSERRIYLGISHGSASILLFLVKAVMISRQPEVCRRLLMEGVAYVLAQYRADQPSAFPIVSGREPHSATLGWAYGDLGVCYGLFVASKFLNYSAGCELASSRALALQANISGPDAWPDASLAYGCTGSAVLFQSFAEASGNPAFSLLANQCLAKSADFDTPANPACGFKAAHPSRAEGADWGIISGVAGIGIVFQAYLQQDYSLAKRLLYII